MLTAAEYQTLQYANRILDMLHLPALTEQEYEVGAAIAERAYAQQGEA